MGGVPATGIAPKELLVPDLAKRFAEANLQSQVRQAMSRHPGFRTDPDMPEAMRRLLDTLDRVTAKEPTD